MRDPIRKQLRWLATVSIVAALAGPARSSEPAAVRITTPMPPPGWALLERELIRAEERACAAFFDRYFDDRGFLECVERWGGDDGPDDAIENLNDWPVLYALGADDEILARFKKAWEGHLRQYTKARTVDVPFARDGMFYKEFHVRFDWFHLGEGLSAFDLAGLCDPGDPRYGRRVRRYAGLYMNEDPGAPNYDPEHRIIRSLFNGSRGPLLRKATTLDWAGDPIEVEGRFRLGHGEHTYAQMLAHFQDYNDIIGDHPLNLSATNLALNAYMLTHESRYKDWVLGYVGAWRHRMAQNDGIIPSNIGLDGTVGGACGGKWYGGVYGWGFTVMNPTTGKPVNRNYHHVAINGFGNAYVLSGDAGFLDAWRRQIDAVNSHAKTEGSRTLYPHMYGDRGWYDYRPEPYRAGATELYYWSMKESDRRRLPADPWLNFLEGQNASYPESALRGDFAALRGKVEAMRRDPSTPDTRLADDPMKYNPAVVGGLVRLMLGGLPPKHQGEVLQARVRYFDPARRRPGLPADVAALVDSIGPDSTSIVLVNLDPVEARTVIVQGGAYGEHRCERVAAEGRTVDVGGPCFRVDLAPGAGGRISIAMKRYAEPPTLMHPWSRDRASVVGE